MADKAKLLKIAQKHLAKGNVDKAITTFQHLVEVAPHDQRLLLRLAELQARVGRKKEAIQNYEKIASVYIQQDFTPKAIAVYKTILRLDPELLTAYEKLADLYKIQGLEAEALSQLENLYTIYENKKDENKQIEVLKIMAEMDHENLGFQVRLGEMLAKKGMKQEAAEAFAKAATTLSRRGFHDRASQLFEKIINLNPDNIAVRRELCGHYLESGQFSEARREIEAIIDLDPDDPRMVLLLGRILFQLGKKNEAEENIEKSIRLFQKNGELENVVREYLFVAQSHLRNEELDEAEAFYRHVLEALPDETKAIKGLISIAESRSDRVDQIDNLLLLGRILARKDDRKGADRAFGKVLEIDPLNEEAKDYVDSGVSISGELSEEEPEGVTGVQDVEDVEAADLESEPGQAEEDSLLPLEVEEELEDTLEAEEISVEDVEELKDLELEEVDIEEHMEVEEDSEEEPLPDIVLEDFEDEAGAGSEPVLEEGTSAEEIGGKEVQISLEDLFAEAKVYSRYGLDEKFEETLRQIRGLAPQDADILQRIEALRHETESPGPESGILNPEETGIPSIEELMEGDIRNSDGTATVDTEQEPGTKPVPESAPRSKAEPTEPFQEDLEEAEFYLSQGLEDEALRIYRSILQRSPGHPVATQALAQSDQQFSSEEFEPQLPQNGTVQEASSRVSGQEMDQPRLETPSNKEIRGKLIVEDSVGEDVGGFLDLADELRSELSDEFEHDKTPETHDEPFTFEEIFAQFKRGIEETLGEEEYETHYNLGIAYKDMGLFDDALREFEIGSRDPDLTQDSLSLMAMCFVEKKDYDSATKAVEKAMEVSGKEARTGLYFQLGEIREKEKDFSGALAAYREVKSRDPSFKGIDEIIERMRVHAELAADEEEMETSLEGGTDDMLSDLIKEVEEMARENSDEPDDEPGKNKKDRISYL